MRLLKENLMVQFSVVSLVVMVAIGVALAVVLANKIQSDAIDRLASEAVDASSGQLLSAITPADLEVPMTGERYDRFHEFVQQSIVSERTARVKIRAKNGTIIYADNPAMVGKEIPPNEPLLKALRGETVTILKVPEDATHATETHMGHLMEVVTPIIFPGTTEPQGAFALYQYYGPTAQRIGSLRSWLFGSMSVGFVLLYGSLIIVVWGGWRTIAGQRSRLESFNTELEQQVRASREEKGVVDEVARTITSTLNIDDVYEKFTQEMKKLVDFDRAIINIVDRDVDAFVVKYLVGDQVQGRQVRRAIPLAGSYTGHITTTGLTLVREDIAADVRFAADQVLLEAGLHSSIMVPLTSKGQVIGTMGLFSCQVGVYGPKEQAILERLANQVAPAVENAQLYERTKQIEQEVYRLSQAVATMNDGLFVIDLDGRITLANPAAERMYGFEPGEIKGVEIWTLRSDVNDISGREIFEEARAGNTWTGEIIARRKNGDEFPIRLSAALVTDEEGQPVGTMGINTDITERKQTEERLKTFAADLERSNQELQDFASVAAHDLQEPLRKVEAFGDRLEAKCGDLLTDQGRDYLSRMLNAAGRMRSLIDDLLTYSRVTSKGESFNPVDLNQVAQEVLSDLEVRIEEVGGRVEVDDLPTIDADPTQMRQLFQNLIGNALKFRRPEDPPVVKIHGKRLDGHSDGLDGGYLTDELYEIIVEDNGIGFEEKYLDRLFTIFQRLHGRGEYEGNGVGLAVCRKIAERHGGNITAKRTEGEGAKFMVTLPMTHSKEVNAE